MNNKGASLIEVIGIIIIIGVIATIALPSVSSFMGKGELTTFIAYERSMEDASKNAVLDCLGSNSMECDLQFKGEVKNIKLSYLINEGFIDPTSKDSSREKCDSEKSFVRVENRGNLNYKFDVCLYCDGYKSDDKICGFEE